MSTRRVMTWLIFWSSVALALAALAWVSVEVVALEKREATAQVQASRQESIRRALWRMDSRMAPILAIEASRPFTDYKALEGSRSAWLRNAGITGGQSPFTSSTNYSYANTYFEFEQIDAANDLEAVGQITSLLNMSQDDVEQALVPTTSAVVSLDELADASASPEPEIREDKADSDYAARKRVADIATQIMQQGAVSEDEANEVFGYQSAKTSQSLRLKDADGSTEQLNTGLASIPELAFDEVESRVDQHMQINQTVGTLRPRWIADDTGTQQLVLVRTALIEGKPVIQGVWLDWVALRNDLLESVDDVMPNSSLVAVTGPRSSMIGGYQLATIPVEFIPPVNAAIISWRWSPATVGLLVTWIAILATIIAVGVVLRAAIVLSERRGRFVSAVTHELRTPLTTFRLYSQMLADGMVTDEEVRTDYLQILKRESERLTGIVENVLEYARLTRNRSSKDKAAGVQTLSPGALVARFRPALARRAQQSNLDLVVSLDLEAHQDRTLMVDPHAVERIMMNLVENACKYAAPVESDEQSEASIEDADTRIHFDITIKDNMLEMLIADHGPGIAPGEGARIFGEFQRGWRGLSNARSGLGLGLALSRGLAKEMDGDLVLTKRRGHGAEFLLTIPLDEQSVDS